MSQRHSVKSSTIGGDSRASEEPSSVPSLSNEQILNELHQIYVNPSDGLLAYGRKLGLHLFAPRRKVNILLIGNHSSGKSSFINWYVDAKVQKTGVAIETQGFTLVTSGKTRETLTGKATLRLFPYLKPLESINGVLPYLTTELTPSKSRRFNLINFIDTPGLADGELHYPYDIEKATLWLGDIADLIFVFFDPIGQALCKRTLNLVEKLMHVYSERMRFFLSKADEAGLESDRQKVMMQIVQELCKRPGLNQCGFEMSTIYIPNHADLRLRDQMCVNQIEDTCREIEKTIALTIQNTFNTMEKDIDQLEELARDKLDNNSTSFHHNVKNLIKLFLVILLCVQFPISVLIYPNRSSFATPPGQVFTVHPYQDWFIYYPQIALNLLYQLLHYYTFAIARLLMFLLPNQHLLTYSSLLSIPILFVSRFFIHFQRTLGLGQMAEMRKILSRLGNVARRRREELYSSYLTQMLHDTDLN